MRTLPSEMPSLDEQLKHVSHFIRIGVAERIDPARLPEMMEDPNRDVRLVVAQRIDPSWFPKMIA